MGPGDGRDGRDGASRERLPADREEVRDAAGDADRLERHSEQTGDTAGVVPHPDAPPEPE